MQPQAHNDFLSTVLSVEELLKWKSVQTRNTRRYRVATKTNCSKAITNDPIFLQNSGERERAVSDDDTI